MVSLSGVNSFCTDLGNVAAAHAQGANNRTLRKAFGQEILSGLFTKCPFCVFAVPGAIPVAVFPVELLLTGSGTAIPPEMGRLAARAGRGNHLSLHFYHDG
jgi:hypothetical protein